MAVKSTARRTSIASTMLTRDVQHLSEFMVEEKVPSIYFRGSLHTAEKLEMDRWNYGQQWPERVHLASTGNQRVLQSPREQDAWSDANKGVGLTGSQICMRLLGQLALSQMFGHADYVAAHL
jgi:hypothetical protein